VADFLRQLHQAMFASGNVLAVRPPCRAGAGSCRPQKFDLGLSSGQLPQLWHDHGVLGACSMIVRLAWDLLQWCGLLLRTRKSLEAENLFLRRQLALYRERGVKPRRVDAVTRVTLTLLSRWFDWRSALVVVQPKTLTLT
jgi:hypothetical protein